MGDKKDKGDKDGDREEMILDAHVIGGHLLWLEGPLGEEHELFERRGITAAEGARRVVWDALQRKNRAALWEEHERAVDAYRAAAEKHEQAREALGRADAELRQVEERIEQRERSRRRG